MSHWKNRKLIYISESESEFELSEDEFELSEYGELTKSDEELFSECENYFPSNEEIRAWAKSTGLNFKIIKIQAHNRKKLPLLIEEINKKYSQEKREKDAYRMMLNTFSFISKRNYFCIRRKNQK